MKYELKPFHALTPFDDMVSATSNGVIVAIPEEAEAIGNLIAAGFTIEGVEEVFDIPSSDA